jgi:hypothetical protein
LHALEKENDAFAEQLKVLQQKVSDFEQEKNLRTLEVSAKLTLL